MEIWMIIHTWATSEPFSPMTRYRWLAAPCIRHMHPFSLTIWIFSLAVKQTNNGHYDAAIYWEDNTSQNSQASDNQSETPRIFPKLRNRGGIVRLQSIARRRAWSKAFAGFSGLYSSKQHETIKKPRQTNTVIPSSLASRYILTIVIRENDCFVQPHLRRRLNWCIDERLYTHDAVIKSLWNRIKIYVSFLRYTSTWTSP